MTPLALTFIEIAINYNKVDDIHSWSKRVSKMKLDLVLTFVNFMFKCCTVYSNCRIVSKVYPLCSTVYEVCVLVVF